MATKFFSAADAKLEIRLSLAYLIDFLKKCLVELSFESEPFELRYGFGKSWNEWVGDETRRS